MYPESFLQWLGGIVVVFGILGWIFVLVDGLLERREKRKKEDE